MISVAGQPVRYQSTGTGEPLVLVHGLSGSSRWWIRNVPALAQYYRVYLVDLPGFGSMNRTRELFELSKMSDWLVAWMQAARLPSAHFIGHSMGGYICMRLAARYPDVVQRLILAAPAARPHKQSIPGYVLPLLSGLRFMSPDFLLTLSWDALRAGPVTLLRATRDLLMVDAQDEIKDVTAPTLLVWGEGDTLVPHSLGHIMRREMADARLLILKRAGHVCMFDQAIEFNWHVLSFLRGEKVGD